MLRTAGHDVRTASDEGLDGRSDADVLAHANAEGRVLLTKNADHYSDLHDEGKQHAGILVVYEDFSRTKHMSLSDVVRAVGNVDRSGIDLARQFVPLNAWNY